MKFLRCFHRGVVQYSLAVVSTPEFDLSFFVLVFYASDGSGTSFQIILKVFHAFRGYVAASHKTEAERPQIQMKVIFKPEQDFDIYVQTRRNEGRPRHLVLKIKKYVIALDVHIAIVDQHRYQSSGVYTKKVGGKVFVRRQ